MSVERFDRDLADVLREIAGEEAPMSLRFRLSDITERAPVGHRLWFATPMRLSMVAAAAVAVLALAIIFLPGESVGPSPSESPSVEPTPSVQRTPPPRVAPTPAPTVRPTTEPTPVVTPTPTSSGEWTGLVWSEPVTPSFTVHLYDLLPWGDGYVAVGAAPDQGSASFTSPDGLHWTVEQRDFPGVPRHLLALGDELFAFMPEFSPNPPGMIVGAPPTTATGARAMARHGPRLTARAGTRRGAKPLSMLSSEPIQTDGTRPSMSSLWESLMSPADRMGSSPSATPSVMTPWRRSSSTRATA